MSGTNLDNSKASFNLQPASPRITYAGFELLKNEAASKLTQTLNVVSKISYSTKKNDIFMELIINGINSTSEEVFTIKVKLYAGYTWDGELSKEAIQNFSKLNSPAIAFPFLRSSLASLCFASNIPTITLPLINFHNFPVTLEEND